MESKELLRKCANGERDFGGANLRWADLRGADLCGANLRCANLYGADLSWADLRGADLSLADMREANLRGANLSWADLRGADLRGANLCYLIFSPSRDSIVVIKDQIQIGCEIHSMRHWRDNYHQIGEKNDYTTEQIKEYGDLIKHAIEIFKVMK